MKFKSYGLSLLIWSILGSLAQVTLAQNLDFKGRCEGSSGVYKSVIYKKSGTYVNEFVCFCPVLNNKLISHVNNESYTSDLSHCKSTTEAIKAKQEAQRARAAEARAQAQAPSNTASNNPKNEVVCGHWFINGSSCQCGGIEDLVSLSLAPAEFNKLCGEKRRLYETVKATNESLKNIPKQASVTHCGLDHARLSQQNEAASKLPMSELARCPRFFEMIGRSGREGFNVNPMSAQVIPKDDDNYLSQQLAELYGKDLGLSAAIGLPSDCNTLVHDSTDWTSKIYADLMRLRLGIVDKLNTLSAIDRMMGGAGPNGVPKLCQQLGYREQASIPLMLQSQGPHSGFFTSIKSQWEDMSSCQAHAKASDISQKSYQMLSQVQAIKQGGLQSVEAAKLMLAPFPWLKPFAEQKQIALPGTADVQNMMQEYFCKQREELVGDLDKYTHAAHCLLGRKQSEQDCDGEFREEYKKLITKAPNIPYKKLQGKALTPAHTAAKNYFEVADSRNQAIADDDLKVKTVVEFIELLEEEAFQSVMMGGLLGVGAKAALKFPKYMKMIQVSLRTIEVSDEVKGKFQLGQKAIISLTDAGAEMAATASQAGGLGMQCR